MKNMSEKKPLQITILGSNSGRNAGDAAILGAIMQIFHEKLNGNVCFEIPTTKPGFIQEQYGKMFKIRTVSMMPWSGTLRILGIPTFASVRRSDLTFIVDGIIFDKKLFNPIFNWLIMLVCIAPWIKFCGRKLVCYNVGIGPLNSFWGRLFAKIVGNCSDLILVREQDSYNLFKEIGVTSDMRITADSVFTNWSASEERIWEIIGKHGLTEEMKAGNVLGFNVTRYVDDWLKKSEKVASRESLIPILAKALVRLKVEKNIVPVICITQVMDAEYGEALRKEIEVGYSYAQQKPDGWKPILISNIEYSNHELLGVFSKCGLFAGMRLHSLIIACRATAPIVALVYAPKVRSFIRQLTTPELGLELADLTAESLFNDLAKAWESRAQIKEKQQVVARELEKLADSAAEIVKEKYYSKSITANKETVSQAVANN
jgi:polysaccharide pyruvyl transferase WcaK-like protein